MKKLVVKVVKATRNVSAAGCGRNWDNVCGRRE